ncbi:MAG: hypothetical protein KIS78_25145 [Labilithrix sp.]|nr:hypothetical protein [Labilithrix sp.]MCW5835711.1 hypothetical protein [Labilithrix sp.]
MTLARGLALSLLPLALLACAAPDDATSTDDADFSSSAGPAAECAVKCSGEKGGLVEGGQFSGDRWASVAYEQDETCTTPPKEPSGRFYRKRAGDPCAVEDTEAAAGGAYGCESFVCGTTGAFVASACVGTRPAGGGRMVRKCADKATACALALEAVGGLCR